MRDLRSAGWTAAKFTGRTAEKAAVNLFRWAATDHTGLSRAVENMPEMGFLASLKHILVQFLIAIVGVVIAGAWIYVVIAYGIPFLLTGSFGG